MACQAGAMTILILGRAVSKVMFNCCADFAGLSEVDWPPSSPSNCARLTHSRYPAAHVARADPAQTAGNEPLPTRSNIDEFARLRRPFLDEGEARLWF